MNKLKMKTPDRVQVNIEQIGTLFPNVITETTDENGVPQKAIDFDLLKQQLSKTIVEDEDERYRLDWPGKKASLLKANTPINKTLRPCREESVNFDSTENLYIEGDNFEVLKILQESYLGKIKMIYIDPPYNTGNDFIYKDNFKKSQEEYEEELGAEDEEGGKLFKNTDSNGRFHSDWLSMIFERLIIARDLLQDDGAIFINIDDNELANVKKICDEIYGEMNFVANVCWKHTQQSKNDEPYFSRQYNALLIYRKSEMLGWFRLPRTEKDNKNYSNPDNDPKGKWRSGDVRSPNYRKTLCYDIKTPSGKAIKPPDKGWRWSEQEVQNKIKTGEIVFSDDETRIIRKIYLYKQTGRTPENVWADDTAGTTRQANAEIKALFDKLTVFDTPKPTNLVRKICKLFHQENDYTVLDFFSGTATTAHAIIHENANDNGNRKFIMVQLSEPCDESSDAFKAGYKTIADIGKERIRRAGKLIRKELISRQKQTSLSEVQVDPQKLDIGFRVYKTADTNMKDVFYHPTDLKQKELSSFQNNIKDDRTAEDLLTQVLLDLGLELSLPIETQKMLNNTVYFVQSNALVACFDKDIDFRIVDKIAELLPLKVVFKDASFKDDKDRINVEERFKRLSPETIISVL